MKLSFIKMHGLGNDYVFIDCFPQATAQIISEKVMAMDDKLYTPIVTAKTSKKEHTTRDQKIRTTLDLMMNL